MDKIKKVSVKLDDDVVTRLIQRKKVRDTYSSVIRSLLDQVERSQ
jgi:predicted CopG family antitoxin